MGIRQFLKDQNSLDLYATLSLFLDCQSCGQCYQLLSVSKYRISCLITFRLSCNDIRVTIITNGGDMNGKISNT